ncbi:MAG: 2-oxoglutarate dehydrogenase complex dihydrolipoyllysine-residue succinyltransferase [Opitutales bacterium]|nr:2-oxoglutarate dehydrogenase complex dihydrolipoyllysine-residue succinyltransferase [Opitutales bacterium]MCH8541468.1 2-oxoglutarate dehydrogenase complex dihydrolipoyllysine-residue succinyltransferase [Opitutales bacterium]
MAVEVKVPSMGESITSGILAAWQVQDGDHVTQDQVLFELETDKITSEGLAEEEGIIRIKVEEGEEVEIGQVVAIIEEGSGEASSDQKEKSAADKEESSTPPSKEEKPASGKEYPLSPAARRAVESTGVDPSTIKGSGKDGRITKDDVLKAAESKDSAPAPKAESTPPKAPQPEAPSPAKEQPAANSERTTRKKMSPLRQRIAQRLVQAQQDAAMLTTFNEVDVSAVKQLRAKYQDQFVKKYDLKLGFMSFFVKAVVHALQEVPAVNAQIDGDSIVTNHFYDIGVAVSTGKGLLVPVIRNCDKLGLAEIEKAIGESAKKAREGKITIEDLEGGVFTISNGGIFGSLLSTPIINPPQSGILGMHTIQERPVAINGEVKIRPMMYLAHSYDHRLIDGSEAVRFLVKIKEAIEDPARLVIGV